MMFKLATFSSLYSLVRECFRFPNLFSVFLFSLCFGFVEHTALAQFDQFRSHYFFRQFNTDQGLSQATVNCILQDSKGFIWLGTDDGLNRFDGNQFKIFRNHQGDSSTIVGNTVHSLYEDKEGTLWVGTSEGLCSYNRHTEKFKLHLLPGVEYYNCVDIKPNMDRIWLAAHFDGVLFIDMKNPKKTQRFDIDKLRGVEILEVDQKDQFLYVGTRELGLFQFNLQTKELKEVKLPMKQSMAKDTYPIWLLQHEDDELWIDTYGGGVFLMNTKTAVIKEYNKENHLLSNNNITSLAKDKAGKVWIGTDGGGLTILDYQKNKADFFEHDDQDRHSISSNVLRTIYFDRHGGTWLGAFNGGLNYLTDFPIHFLTFRHNPVRPFTLSFNPTLSFCESNGRLYVGTDGGGLNYFEHDRFYSYRFPSNVENPNVILTIHRLRGGGLLLGTYQNGLYHLKPNNEVVQYKFNKNDSTTIGSDIVWDIDEDKVGNIWLSTELGLNRFNIRSGKFTHHKNLGSADNKLLFTNEYTQCLLVDSTENLWVGYYGVLAKYDLTSGALKQYGVGDEAHFGVPNKQILSLHQDKTRRGVMWFSAKGEALVKFDTQNKKVTFITESKGLPNNLITAVECDNSGYVWFSSNKGLVRYNENNNSFHVFDSNFGVDTQPFKDNASYQTSEGYIIMGGANGFTAFKPEEINYVKKDLAVTFTGFELFNTEVPIDNTLLSKSITETKEISLSQDKAKFISFTFSALQYAEPSNIIYQYKLEGFEDEWHDVESRKVSFTNLPAANYKLKVRAGYSSGVWGDESTLVIKVIPPWWLTIYAKVAVSFMGIVLVIGMYRYRLYNLRRRQAMLEQIVRKQNSEIVDKNEELAAQNEELTQQNEELSASRETISNQNRLLTSVQVQLRETNQSLEGMVKQRTLTLNETIEQLNKTIKELDAFLYSASHDLVAPLKSIRGLVYLAKKEESHDTTLQYFGMIESSVLKLEQIIRSLMQHSFNANATSALADVDLKKLVEETVQELRLSDLESNPSIGIYLQDAIVKTDAPRMKIILLNLIGNAIKYQDTGKTTHKVDIDFEKTGSHWQLTVADNGIGIDPEHIAKVFEMFYRATESAKGSGLGLYIVKEAVTRLGGEIKVESQLHVGTRFIVTFPFVID